MTEDSRLPMGIKWNSHLGYVELPSQILEVEIGNDYLVFDCEDGIYQAYKSEEPSPMRVRKVKDKPKR